MSNPTPDRELPSAHRRFARKQRPSHLHRNSHLLLAFAALVPLLLAGTARILAEQPGNSNGETEPPKFIRVVLEEEIPTALQTAIVRYESATNGQQQNQQAEAPTPAENGGDQDGDQGGTADRPEQPPRPLVVDLVGVIHIGDTKYYEELNHALADYDAVLYEIVAPEGTRIPRGGEGTSRSPISGVQSGMSSLLDLEFQLRIIDYTPEHFVHADMSPEELYAAMERNDESMWKTMLRMAGYEMARQNAPSRMGQDTNLLAALFSRNRALALKRVLSRQLGDEATAAIDAISGENGSTLIAGRNRKALEVLEKQIEAGKRRLAILYGAGHMVDFDKRLREEFDLRPTGTRWLTAWDMSEPTNADSPAESPANTHKQATARANTAP